MWNTREDAAGASVLRLARGPGVNLLDLHLDLDLDLGRRVLVVRNAEGAVPGPLWFERDASGGRHGSALAPLPGGG